MPGEAFLNARFRHPLESRKSRGPFGVELGTEEGEQLVVIHGFSQEEGCRAMVDLSLTYYYPDCGASGLQPGRCSRCRLIDLVEELPCRTNSAHRSQFQTSVQVQPRVPAAIRLQHLGRARMDRQDRQLLVLL